MHRVYSYWSYWNVCPCICTNLFPPLQRCSECTYVKCSRRIQSLGSKIIYLLGYFLQCSVNLDSKSACSKDVCVQFLSRFSHPFLLSSLILPSTTEWTPHTYFPGLNFLSLHYFISKFTFVWCKGKQSLLLFSLQTQDSMKFIIRRVWSLFSLLYFWNLR